MVRQPFRLLQLLQRRRRQIAAFTLAVGLGLVLWPSDQLRSDNFVFYLPNAREVVPLEPIDNAQYLPLLKVLNLIGTVSGVQEKGNSMKVWLGKRQLELRRDEKKVRLDKFQLKLSRPVRISNGQWMIPLEFLYSVVPKLTEQPLEYRVGDLRMFIGDVRPASFLVRLDPVADGARLTLQFTSKVTARSAASNGKWLLYLGDRPVEPLEPIFHFQNRYVSEMRFDDQDGVPKLVITPAAGGLNFYPSLSAQGQVLQVVVSQAAAAASQQPPAPAQAPPAAGPAPAPGVAPSAPALAAQAPPAPPPPPLPAIVLDAGHGGHDTGARSRDGVLEKDLVAQLVERVRAAVAATQKYRVVLTRTGDADLNFDQRDITTNIAHPVAVFTFHAGNLGALSPRVVVYTYQAASPAPGEEVPQLFVAWTRVQELHLDASRRLAGALQQQFSAIAGLTANSPDQAPVRQLRSIDAPAVAIEVGSLEPDLDAGALNTPALQQQIANAVVQALTAFREGAS